MKLTQTAAIMAASLLALTACSGGSNSADHGGTSQKTAVAADKLQTKFVTIATGGASGPYNILATSLAEAYTKEFGVNSKTQTTGASIENINLINQKKAEMAFVMSDALSDAVHGVNNFSQKINSVSQIASLYPNYVQVVASSKSGIKTLSDLRGKRVAVGAQNSGVEVNARNLIQGFGMTYDDLKVDYLGYAEAADALKAGKIDAAFLTSGLPNSSLMELQQGFDLQLVAIPADKIAEIAKDKSYFVALNIPKGTYGNAEDVPTAAIRNALIVSSDLSEDDVYKLTKSFFANLPVLQTAHQAAKEIDPVKAKEGFVAPMHPGAKKYFDEVAQ